MQVMGGQLHTNMFGEGTCKCKYVSHASDVLNGHIQLIEDHTLISTYIYTHCNHHRAVHEYFSQSPMVL